MKPLVIRQMLLPHMKAKFQFLIFGVALFFCCATSFAQMKWGVKGGINYTTLIDGWDAYQYGVGFNAGCIDNIKLGNRFFILAELLYSSKGIHFTEGSTSQFKYLSLPVLAGYKLIGSLECIAGLEFNYLLNKPIEGYTFQRFDLEADAGLRYGISKSWGLDLRMMYGLTKIQKLEKPYSIYGGPNNDVVIGTVYDTYEPFVNFKNQGYQFSVFYYLNTKSSPASKKL